MPHKQNRATARSLLMAILAVAMTAVTILAASSVAADEDGDRDDDDAYHDDYIYGLPADPSEAWILASGGRIYDNWIETLDAEKPKRTHPAWPAANTKKKGATTWRCKSCHGWDYAGRDGAYAKGSYKTGIRGVRAASGRDPVEIATLLRGPLHRYTVEMIPDEAMRRVAAFVSRGQIDVAAYVNADKSVNGDPARGKALFQNICAACHGFDGRAQDWGDEDEPGYVGTEAQANPWEVLHKIRAGHPGVEMPALMPLPIQSAVDVLSYTQTLPAK